MLVRHELSFQKGSIITSDLLETMYRQPVSMIEMLFQDYSDGIISGMDLSERDGTLFISKGVYKHKEKLYYSETDISLTPESGCFVSGQKYAAIIEEKSISNNAAIFQHQLNIKTVPYDDTINKDDIMIIFRGTPVLPHVFENSETFCNNKIDLLPLKKSAYGKRSTYCPYIFKLILEKMMENRFKKDIIDYLVINNIQMYGYVPVEIMYTYINSNINISIQEQKNTCFLDRYELLNSFCDLISSEYKAEENNNYNDAASDYASEEGVLL